MRPPAPNIRFGTDTGSIQSNYQPTQIGGSGRVMLVTECEARGRGSLVLPPVGVGEAVGEFIEGVCADQVVLGGVIARRLPG